MKAKVYVTLKKGVLDTQGRAVLQGLNNVGMDKVKDIRIGKFIEVEVDASSKEEAEKIITESCEKMLANVVMENYRIEIED